LGPSGGDRPKGLAIFNEHDLDYMRVSTVGRTLAFSVKGIKEKQIAQAPTRHYTTRSRLSGSGVGGRGNSANRRFVFVYRRPKRWDKGRHTNQKKTGLSNALTPLWMKMGNSFVGQGARPSTLARPLGGTLTQAPRSTNGAH